MQGRRGSGRRLFATPPPLLPRRGLFIEAIEEEEEEEVPAHQQEATMDSNDGNVHDNEVRLEMREFARPMMALPGSCIVLGQAARNYELKGTHLNMLPNFHCLPSEDPLSFIRDFYSVVQQMPLQNLNEDQLRMRCFPHCLKDRAKNWLTSLPDNSLQSWEECFHKFISKFYSHQKTTLLRQRLATFAQQDGEAFHEAFERFKQLQIECPHHRYSNEMLNQFFYDGLTTENQCLVDVAAGGTVGTKTANEMSELFEMISSNSQQKSVRGNARRSSVHEANEISAIAIQMEKMQQDMKKLLQGNAMGNAMGNDQRHGRRAQCNACREYRHTQNQCHSQYDEEDAYEQAHWLNNKFNQQRQQGRGMYSNTYNQQWRNNPNFSWRNNDNVLNPQPQGQRNYQRLYGQNDQMQHRQQGQSSQQNPLEDTVQEMMKKMEAMQQKWRRNGKWHNWREKGQIAKI